MYEKQNSDDFNVEGDTNSKKVSDSDPLKESVEKAENKSDENKTSQTPTLLIGGALAILLTIVLTQVPITSNIKNGYFTESFDSYQYSGFYKNDQFHGKGTCLLYTSDAADE